MLDIVERPLLGFLHLDHHLLDLLKLLEAVGLHFLELLLFRDKHIQAFAGLLTTIFGLEKPIFSPLRDAMQGMKIFCDPYPFT